MAVTTRLSDLLQWARKWSLFQYPFVTACCGMEFMATAAPRYDIARFGAEAPRFSPRQSDVLWVVGTISQRQGPAVRRIWEQMADPKWVIAFGTCASCGGFYDNYTTIPGVDKVIPVDVYIPGLSASARGRARRTDAAPRQDSGERPQARGRAAEVGSRARSGPDRGGQLMSQAVVDRLQTQFGGTSARSERCVRRSRGRRGHEGLGGGRRVPEETTVSCRWITSST